MKIILHVYSSSSFYLVQFRKQGYLTLYKNNNYWIIFAIVKGNNYSSNFDKRYLRVYFGWKTMKLKDCHHNEVFRWVLIDEIFFPKMLYTKKIEAYHKKEVLRHLEYHRKINISGIFMYITVKNNFLDFHWLVYIRKFFHYTLFNQIFLFPMVVCLQCFSTKKRFMCWW